MKEKYFLNQSVREYIARALVITTLLSGIGFSMSLDNAEAAALTSVSDTLSDSDIGYAATHTIAYTNGTTTNAGETIRITFDPTTDRFNGVQNLTITNVTSTGFTIVSACGGGPAEVTLATSTGANDRSLIFTVCAGDTISAGAKVVSVLGSASLSNPTSSGSYIIRIAGTQLNNGDTRVAIIDDVVLTASVDTSFTFTIAGVATGTTINGVTTTRASTATTLAFGTLPLTSPVTLGQLLTVSTNAVNGFVVTVREDQNPTSLSGADIDMFRDGNATTTPSAWVAPATTLGNEMTYGHFGLTSNDADLNSGEFTSATFVGNFHATTTGRQVFSATGTSDGTTQNIGIASVAYRIQIGALQEAAAEYTNALTYVATPTF